MRPHLRFSVEDGSQVGEARRAAQAIAVEQGFDEEAAGRLALIVTELGTNLVRHAGPHRDAALLLAPEADGVRVMSLDKGPGMDLARCLGDGFSTGGTSGTGLGAVKRLAARFAGWSAPGQGAILVAQAGPRVERLTVAAVPPPPFDVAGLALAAPGETVCGDAWTLKREDGRWTVLVADGLGHGPSAAEASDRAVALLQAAPPRTPAAFLESAHDAMRDTRGAAVAMVAMPLDTPRLSFAGAGNISGRLISGVADRTLLSQHGTLGLQVRRLQDVDYDWPEHAVLVLHSDGIQTRWKLDDAPGLLQAEPAVLAGWILREHLRGRDDATVVVARRHPASGRS